MGYHLCGHLVSEVTHSQQALLLHGVTIVVLLLLCRYERDEVIKGNPYSGFDRHNGEIAGFHLDG